MKRLTALVVLSLLATSIRTDAIGPAAGHFDDPQFGFSVDLPAIGGSRSATVVQRLTVAGPAADGFAPNCNVQIQRTDMDLDAYLATTRKQFESVGVQLLETERRTVSGLPASRLHYAGDLAGRHLRFVALAVIGGDQVWLVTCTALAESFHRHEAAFLELIDSFTVTRERTPGVAADQCPSRPQRTSRS